MLPGQSAAMVHESIADPNAEIVKGFPPNVMPANYEQTLTPKELDDLVQYLLQSTQSGGKSKSG
jgi:cytochrome c oxidase subunit 2